MGYTKETCYTIEYIAQENLFLNKIGEILFTEEYSEKTKQITRSILDFLYTHEYISKKQYALIINCRKAVYYHHSSISHNSSQFNSLIERLNDKWWDHAFDEANITMSDLM